MRRILYRVSLLSSALFYAKVNKKTQPSTHNVEIGRALNKSNNRRSITHIFQMSYTITEIVKQNN